LAIDANDTLDVIAGLFEKYDYDGMPVVDSSRKLLGIITAYDMILQSSDMHLPTLLKIMDQISTDKADKRALDEHFGKLRDIKATSIMNPKVITVGVDATLEEAAKVFADHHKVNPLCVVDAEGRLAGVISRYDIIKEFPTRSETEVEQAVKDVQEGFVLVTKRRPLVWKYLAVAAFAAGLIAATALIIRIVQKSG
jgi:CBS domain-containing protein